jgi:23S rRNA pseudouridine955/2504/2580 synthase
MSPNSKPARKLTPRPAPQPAHDPAPEAEPALLTVQKWLVAEEFSGQRIDNYLISRLKGVPKTRIYRMLRSGEVRVNGGRVASDYRVQPEDLLRIPPVRTAHGTSTTGQGQASGHVSPAAAKSISEQIQIVLEDDAVLAINKPFGVAVHGGSGVKLGVIEALRQTLKPVFLELVHRLDRETSGLMLLAKKRPALTEFHRQLREGEMRKRYLALVWGIWPAALDQINQPLHKWVNAKGERWVRIDPAGQVAITRVKCLQRVHDSILGPVSLLQCEPVTGRTHQLRVHLMSQGHPIIGDPKYGDQEKDLATKPLGFKRMFLHAWQLRCLHPKTNETLFLKAEMDQACKTLLEKLKMDQP